VQSLRHFFLSQPCFFPCLSQDNADLELGVACFKVIGKSLVALGTLVDDT